MKLNKNIWFVVDFPDFEEWAYFQMLKNAAVDRELNDGVSVLYMHIVSAEREIFSMVHLAKQFNITVKTLITRFNTLVKEDYISFDNATKEDMARIDLIENINLHEDLENIGLIKILDKEEKWV